MESNRIESNRINRIHDTPLKEKSLVKINFAIAQQSFDKHSFMKAKLSGTTYFITIDTVQEGSEEVITYIGSIYNKNFEKVPGSLLLTDGKDSGYGLIRSPSGIYQLIPASRNTSGLYFLQKMEQTPAKGITDFDAPRSNDAQPPLEFSSFENSVFSSMTSGTHTIDLLVLFTPSAASKKGGISGATSWINTIVADYNQKLAELGFSHYSLSLKAALTTSWPAFSQPYNENTTHNGDNACFQSGSNTFCDSIVADQFWLSTNSTVTSYRNQYSADLVVLITSNSHKHSLDNVQGFAGLKNDFDTPQTHGTLGNNNDCYNHRDCGEFVTIRDDFALSNLTFHHEVGHALGLRHEDDAVRTFGFYKSGLIFIQQTSNGNHLVPFTIMNNNDHINTSVCLWSWYTSSPFCEVRLPFYAHPTKSRTMYYSGIPAPRVFTPNFHVLVDNIVSGMNWLESQR